MDRLVKYIQIDCLDILSALNLRIKQPIGAGQVRCASAPCMLPPAAAHGPPAAQGGPTGLPSTYRGLWFRSQTSGCVSRRWRLSHVARAGGTARQAQPHTLFSASSGHGKQQQRSRAAGLGQRASAVHRRPRLSPHGFSGGRRVAAPQANRVRADGEVQHVPLLLGRCRAMCAPCRRRRWPGRSFSHTAPSPVHHHPTHPSRASTLP